MKFLHSGKLHQRSSRRGGMLILVLMIFAVSLILISSAMTITLASRNRYYVDAERSQERLTLSCAAETILDAIQKQEITDAQVKTMASTNGTTEYKITGAQESKLGGTASSDSGKDIAPGLSNNSTSNQTYFTVKPASEGSNDVIMEFATIIDVTGSDSNYERLRVYLEYTGSPELPEICANMVTAGSDDDPNVLDIQDLMVNTDKSYTVFHGNISLSGYQSQTYVENTAVFTGKLGAAQGSRFMHDVVFYGKDATIDVTSIGGNGISTTGNIYFLGIDYGESDNNQLNVFNGTPPESNFNIVSDGIYFYNARMYVTNQVRGADQQSYQANVGGYFSGYNRPVWEGKYWVVDGGSSVERNKEWAGAKNVIIVKDGSATFHRNQWETGSQITETVYDNEAALLASSVQDDKNMYNTLKTKGQSYLTDEALKKAAEQQVPSMTAQSNAYGSYASKAPTSNTDPTKVITSGCGTKTITGTNNHFVMSGSYSNGDVTLEGDSSIYMTGNVDFNNFRIRVADTDHLTIVLAKNATLTMHEGNEYSHTGIISVSMRNGSLEGKASETDMRGKSGQKPACYIIGLGANTVTLQHPAVLDAYVSLAGTGNDAGTFVYGGGSPSAPVAFYGRVEAAKIKSGAGGQGGQMFMEYCPGVNEDSNTPQPLQSAYTVKSYEYYYT